MKVNCTKCGKELIPYYNCEDCSDKKFSRDFESWHETHFEVVSAIVRHRGEVVEKRYYFQGTGGLYELAQELTDEFEELNKDRKWNGEFFDEIEEFLEQKLKN